MLSIVVILGALVSVGLIFREPKLLSLASVPEHGAILAPPAKSAPPDSSSPGPSPTSIAAPPPSPVEPSQVSSPPDAMQLASAPTALTSRGVIAGYVYDDLTGLPIAGAVARLVSLDGGPSGAAVPEFVTDARGRYRFASLPGLARIQISKSGFTAADRLATVAAGKRTDPLDARLTPLDAGGRTVASVLGGTLTCQAGGAILTVPAAALGADREIHVTRLGQQGLIGPLPLGWSPAAAVDIGPGDLSLIRPATLAVVISPTLASGVSLKAARWDETAGAWIALADPVPSAGSGRFELSLGRGGQYVLLLGDPAPAAPPAPVTGQPLAGRGTPALAANPVVEILPSPKILFAGPDAASDVAVRAATTATLPSGMPFRVNLIESFDFADGTHLYPEPAPHTFGFYAYPDGSPVAPRAGFVVAPSRVVEPYALNLGIIQVTASVPADPTAPYGSVVGSTGGALRAVTGEELTFSRWGAREDLPVLVARIARDEFPPAIPTGSTFLAALAIDFHGGRPALPASLAVPAPADLPVSAQVLLARLTEVNGASFLALVGPASRVTPAPVAGGMLRFSGIAQEGRYVLLRADAPLGTITGMVTGPAGAPVEGTVVSVDTLGLVSLADREGRYLLAAPAGPAQVTALDPVTGDRTTRTAMVAAGRSVTGLELRLAAPHPTVLSVTPADGSQGVPLTSTLTIAFSERMERSSLAAGVALAAGATAVSGTLSLAPGDKIATFRPDRFLASDTAYRLTVAASVVDQAGRPLGSPYVAQFTSADVTPPARPAAGAIAATIPDAGGFTTVTGTQGTADPDGLALVKNRTRGELTTVLPLPDGSFSIRVRATLADRMELILKDAAGNATTVPLGLFRDPDGRTVVNSDGGRVEGMGGVAADVPAGALPDGTIVQVSPLQAADFDRPAPDGFALSAGIRLNLGGARATGPITLTVLAPPDATPQDQVVLARAVTWPGHPDRKLWEPAGRAYLQDGQYQGAGFEIPSGSASANGAIQANSLEPGPATTPAGDIVAEEGDYSYLRRQDGSCVSYVAVQYQYGFDTAFLAVGTPFGAFYTPSLAMQRTVYPAVCNQSLQIEVRNTSTDEVIKRITRTAPAARDVLSDPGQLLTDDGSQPTITASELPGGIGDDLHTIRLQFSEPMSYTSTIDHFQVKDSKEDALEGWLKLLPGDASLVFRPYAPLHLGEPYTITLTGATDRAGNPLATGPLAFIPQAPVSLSKLSDVPEILAKLRKCGGASGCNAEAREVAHIGDTIFVYHDDVGFSGTFPDPANAQRLLAIDVGDPENPRLIGSMASSRRRKMATLTGARFTTPEGVPFAGDLLIDAGVPGSNDTATLRVYDVSPCTIRPVTVPNCLGLSTTYRGVKILADPLNLYTSLPNVPKEWGLPVQVEILHSQDEDGNTLAAIAYVATQPIGIQAVDITKAFNAGTPWNDPNRAPDGLYSDRSNGYLTVPKNRVLKLREGATAQGQVLTVLTAQLSSFDEIRLPRSYSRLDAGANFVFDLDGDGNLGQAEEDDGDPTRAAAELRDLAVLASFPWTEGGGELAIVDVSGWTGLGHQRIEVISRIPLPGSASAVRVDPAAQVAYAEVSGQGVAIVDLGFLRGLLSGQTSLDQDWDANDDGVDDRIIYLTGKAGIEIGGLGDIGPERGLVYLRGTQSGVETLRLRGNIAFVRETEVGSGQYVVVNQAGLPIFRPDDGVGRGLIGTGRPDLSMWSDTNLSNAVVDNITVTLQTPSDSFTGPLAETAVDSGIFVHSGHVVTLTIAPPIETSDSVTDSLEAMVTSPSLGLQDSDFHLLELAKDANVFWNLSVEATVILGGNLRSEITDSLRLQFSTNFDPVEFDDFLYETSPGSRVFTRDASDIELAIAQPSELDPAKPDSLQIAITSSFLNVPTITLALVETAPESLVFSSDPPSQPSDIVPLNPTTNGQGVFYVRVLDSSVVGDKVDVTVSSDIENVKVEAHRLSPGLFMTGKLVLLPEGATESYPGITAIHVPEWQSARAADLVDTQEKSSLISAFLTVAHGVADSWVKAFTYPRKPAFLGNALFASDLRDLKPSDLKPLDQIESLVDSKLGYTSTKRPSLTYEDVRQSLPQYSLWYFFGHGTTKDGTQNTPFVGFKVVSRYGPTFERVTVHPEQIRQNIGNNHYDLVFLNACLSADPRPGSKAEEMANAFDARIYVGWQKTTFVAVANKAALVFFEELGKGDYVGEAVDAVRSFPSPPYMKFGSFTATRGADYKLKLTAEGPVWVPSNPWRSVQVDSASSYR